MPLNLTQNHLMLLFSDNITVEEKLNLLAEVKKDYQLNESYSELKKAYASLVKVVKRPPAKAINNILQYSQGQMSHARA